MAKENFYQRHKTAILVTLAVILTALFLQPTTQLGGMNSQSFSEDSLGSSFATVSSKNMRLSAPDYAPSPEYSSSGPLSGQTARIEKYANALYEVETAAYEATRNSVEGVVTSYSGYYTNKNEGKQTYGDKEYRTFEITLKVPVASFETVLSYLKSLEGIKSLNVNANDVTLEYYDTKAYLDNYVVERTRLLKLYEKTATVEELVALEKALSELQIKIDQHSQRLKDLERRTDYSTVSVSIREKPEVIESFYEMTSLRVLLRNVLASFDSVFNLVAFLSGYLIIGGLVWLLYSGVRRLRGK